MPHNKQTKTYNIPLCHCPNCNSGEIFTLVPFEIQKPIKHLDIKWIAYICSKCHTIHNTEQRMEPLKWFSEQELLHMGIIKIFQGIPNIQSLTDKGYVIQGITPKPRQ